MAKYGSGSVYAIFVGGYNLISYLTGQSHKKSVALEDATSMGESWRNMQSTGVREFDLAYEGFYDDAATTGIDARVVAQNGNTHVISVLPDGNVLSKYFIGFKGPVQAAYERLLGIASLHKARITYQGSGEVEDGVVVKTHGAVTTDADTESAPHDGAAASALGAVGYLQCTAITLDTATDLVVKLRHSADASSWADLGTFTALTARGAQRLAIAAGANMPRRYLATSWAWTGGAGAGSTATIFVGCHRIGAQQ